MDLTTLVLTILASVCGAWAGVGVVVQWPRHRIQRGMGLALLVAAAILLAKLTRFLPPGGSATGLSGNLLMIAMICNFVFGALMMIGVGAYAPIMIMISLLGMEPDTAFPIMMGSCAFLMPVAGMRFIQSRTYDARAALGLTIGGVPAVLFAAFVFTKLPFAFLPWLVLCVVVYSALSMLWAAQRERSAGQLKPSVSMPSVDALN